jgi:hypothetical protein
VGESILEVITLHPSNLSDLIQQLKMIKSRIDERRSKGFEPEGPEFKWTYLLGEEIGASYISCPICKGFAQQDVFRGDQLDSNFPAKVPLPNNRIYPNVHKSYDSPSGGEWKRECGCELELHNSGWDAARILFDDIMTVVFGG